ncbi:MAG: Fic family protein [Sulfuritalea sp.]|nr:Fic family protein [Sulfuritalea sp.]
MRFDEFFTKARGSEEPPHDWQEGLAAQQTCSSRLIRIPTGFGKTLGVLGAWAWNRLYRRDERWPRRLIWCLPMRVLVEQTREEAERALCALDLLREGSNHDGKAGVHLLMGGADGGEWQLYPEHCAVLIGTQDMLLSRAMNRGYASPRARWPMEFGLLNQDCLWVMDEVQLMDVGLATSAQLQAFRDDDAGAGKSLRPSFTWWMSATLQRDWLAKSPDTAALTAVLPATRIESGGRAGHLWDDVFKPCAVEPLKDAKALASRVAEKHVALGRGAAGPTLVVVNTVKQAVGVWEVLRADRRIDDTDIHLVHSRFRPAERAGWRDEFLNKEACAPGTDRIIVATQVIEAGVDFSAGLLVTELAPWASLVQRFGRCARWGGKADVIVADFNHQDDKTAAPYRKEMLDAAREALLALRDVAPLHLEAFEETHPELLPRLYPYDPTHLLLRHELDELFDTTPDLTGSDIDISRFIRSGEERDLQMFWADVPGKVEPQADLRPSREALCAVPFLKARDWLCGEETKTSKKPRLKNKMRAWVWDWLEGAWRRAERRDLYPGQTVLVAAACGGYDRNKGWAPAIAALDTDILLEFAGAGAGDAADRADAAQDDESLSACPWKTIATHGRETGDGARALANSLAPALADLFDLAGRWHDAGKAHSAFQGSIQPPKPGVTLAKAPDSAWLKGRQLYPMPDGTRRPGFRHELASVLALFGVLQRHDPGHAALLGPWRELLDNAGFASPLPPAGEVPGEREIMSLEAEILALDAAHFDLLAYLVCAHHGKLRLAWHACPADQAANDGAARIRGVREGDQLPPVLLAATDGTPQQLPATRLDLAPAAAGLSPRTGASWTERVLALLARHGPFTLAWLEALLRAADQRASKNKLADPLLEGQNDEHGLETNCRTVAQAASRGAVTHPLVADSPQSGPQHGFRGGTGGREDAGSRTQAPRHATRYLTTTLGILSYVELAPHLSRRVQNLEADIAEGHFALQRLDEDLIREFHRRVCGDLVPGIAGRWRRVDVQVSDHEAPAYPRVSPLMRDYCLDLQARLAALSGPLDDHIPEFLAFAEGRLLWIHPFEDFNGRTTRVLLAELLRRLELPVLNPTPDPGAETDRYLQALKAADRADWQPLVAFWLERFDKEGKA